MSKSTEEALRELDDLFPAGKNQVVESGGTGLKVLGAIQGAFALFIILVPLVHILANGFKIQFVSILLIGGAQLALGTGLFLRKYWAWICSAILFSLLLLGNIAAIALSKQPGALGSVIICIIVLVVLNKCRDQVIRN